jgi:hypothetical protein
MNADLESLLRTDRRIWRGKGGHNASFPVVASGFAALDRLLPGGGWPYPALIEILAPAWGIGELSLLLPAMRQLNRDGRWLIWIAPPFVPYAPALAGQGLDLQRTLVVDIPDSDTDRWWSMEKLLRHPGAGLVMAWPQRIQPVVLRRLQLAAEEGGTIGVLFHGLHGGSTPAALRLAVAPADDGLEVRVLKARGGWVGGMLNLGPIDLGFVADASEQSNHVG